MELTDFSCLDNRNPTISSIMVKNLFEKCHFSNKFFIMTTLLRKDWDYMDWQKKDPKGLEDLKISNAAAFDKLRNEYYNNK